MDVPFHYIDLRAFCFATEREDRVETALRLLLPEGYEIEREVTTGYHGDEIVVLSTRVENNDDMRVVFGHVLGLDTLGDIVGELEDRVDEKCSFFLQLDKQAAYNGTVKRGRGIMLRAKIEAYPARKSTAVDVVKAGLEQ